MTIYVVLTNLITSGVMDMNRPFAWLPWLVVFVTLKITPGSAWGGLLLDKSFGLEDSYARPVSGGLVCDLAWLDFCRCDKKQTSDVKRASGEPGMDNMASAASGGVSLASAILGRFLGLPFVNLLVVWLAKAEVSGFERILKFSIFHPPRDLPSLY